MSLAQTVVGAMLLGFLLVAVYSSITVVKEDEMKALFTFGEMDAVLYPGLNFVPPFVSSAYPIETEEMIVEKKNEMVSVPQEFRQEIRKSDLTD